MSTVRSLKVKRKASDKTPNYPINVEEFGSAIELANSNKTRKFRGGDWDNMQEIHLNKNWHYVSSYSEALGYMRDGYQANVDKIKKSMKIEKSGYIEKRFAFYNNIHGFAPVVPLAMMGVPNNMIDAKMKPIKAKVLSVYYDMTDSAMVEPEDILHAGEKFLGILMKLERAGYRFNLYGVQSYSGDCGSERGADILCVKVKSANQPLDLKRTSFPLMHPAFFRVIGFDWYSKFEKATYRSGYGRAIKHTFGDRDTERVFKEIFGDNAVFITGAQIRENSDEYVEEVLTNGRKKN